MYIYINDQELWTDGTKYRTRQSRHTEVIAFACKREWHIRSIYLYVCAQLQRGKKRERERVTLSRRFADRSSSLVARLQMLCRGVRKMSRVWGESHRGRVTSRTGESIFSPCLVLNASVSRSVDAPPNQPNDLATKLYQIWLHAYTSLYGLESEKPIFEASERMPLKSSFALVVLSNFLFFTNFSDFHYTPLASNG